MPPAKIYGYLAFGRFQRPPQAGYENEFSLHFLGVSTKVYNVRRFTSIELHQSHLHPRPSEATAKHRRRCLLVATALININAAAGPLPLVSPSYAPARLEMRGGEPYTNQVVRVGFQDTQGHWRDTYSNGDAIVLFVGEYDTFAVAQSCPKNMALLLLHPPPMIFRDVRAPAAAEVRRMTELRISVTFEGYKEKKAVLHTLRDINKLERTTSLKFSNDLEYFEIILERLHSLEREGLDVFEVTGDGKGWEDVRRTVASARGY
ncbi:hypothetical protein F5877DRAFT_83467 [Lentinula edodes]|nr:hypothetical protein F5877DRAFT_83467 [Lentinula edodes]